MIKKLLTAILSIFMMIGIFTNNINKVYADDAPATVGDILEYAKKDFPESPENGWIDLENNAIIYKNNDYLYIKIGDLDPTELVSLEAELVCYGDYCYEASNNDYYYDFMLDEMTLSVLSSICYYDEDFNFYYEFKPVSFVADLFGESFNYFPRDPSNAWKDDNDLGYYIYINDDSNELVIYDSTDQLYNSISLDTKLPPGDHSLWVEDEYNLEINSYEDIVDNICYESYKEDELLLNFIFEYEIGEIFSEDGYPTHSSCWVNDNGVELYFSDSLEYVTSKFCFVKDDEEYFSNVYSCFFDLISTDDNNYKSIIHDEHGNEITYTFILGEDGKTKSIKVEGYPDSGYNGTYVTPAPKKVSEIVEKSNNPFPNSIEDCWLDKDGNYAYISDGNLILHLKDGQEKTVNLNTNTVKVQGNTIYYVEDGLDGGIIYFYIEGTVFNNIFYKQSSEDTDYYCKVHPFNLGMILPDNFPTEEQGGWFNINGSRIYYNTVTDELCTSNTSLSCSEEIPKNITDDYVIESEFYDLSFKLDSNNKIKKIIIINADDDHKSAEGEYLPTTKLTALLDIMFDGFPTNEYKAWLNDKGSISYLSGNSLLIGNKSFNTESTYLVYYENEDVYRYYLNNTIYTFNLTNDVLSSITVSGSGIEIENGIYTVPVFAKIGSTNYYSFEDALDAVQANEIIIITHNIEYTSVPGILINKNFSFTIDFKDGTTSHKLKFYTMGEGCAFKISNNTNVTFKNVIFWHSENTKKLKTFIVDEGSSLVLDSCQFSSNKQDFIENSGSVSIKGGSYEKISNTQLKGSFAIDGGTYKNCEPLINAGRSDNSNADLEVGTISVKNAIINAEDKPNAYIVFFNAKVSDASINNVAYTNIPVPSSNSSSFNAPFYVGKGYKSTLNIDNMTSDSKCFIYSDNNPDLVSFRANINSGKYKYETGYFCKDSTLDNINISEIVNASGGYYCPSELNDNALIELNDISSQNHSPYDLDEDSAEYIDGYKYVIVKKYETSPSSDEPVYPSDEPVFYTSIPFGKFYNEPDGPLNGRIEIDDNIVPEGSYTFGKDENGNLYIKLTRNYLENIPADKHTITIVSDDGFTTCDFVLKASPTPDPSPRKKPTSYTVPNTGIR